MALIMIAGNRILLDYINFLYMGYHNVVPNPHLVCIMPYWEGNHHFRVQNHLTAHVMLIYFVLYQLWIVSTIGFGNDQLGVTKQKWQWTYCKISAMSNDQLYGWLWSGKTLYQWNTRHIHGDCVFLHFFDQVEDKGDT